MPRKRPAKAKQKKPSKYYIDQSGKIEQTSQDTVLAYSNGVSYAIVIPRKVKRQAQELFRLCGLTKTFVYYLFAVGIFYLLADFKQKQEIVVDVEYPGKDKLIKALVLSFLTSHKKQIHDLRFARIGNRPRVHYAAKDVFDKRILPNRRLTLTEIVGTIKKTDGRLRGCLSTLVDARPRSLVKSTQKFGKSQGKIV